MNETGTANTVTVRFETPPWRCPLCSFRDPEHQMKTPAREFFQESGAGARTYVRCCNLCAAWLGGRAL